MNLFMSIGVCCFYRDHCKVEELRPLCAFPPTLTPLVNQDLDPLRYKKKLRKPMNLKLLNFNKS